MLFLRMDNMKVTEVNFCLSQMTRLLGVDEEFGEAALLGKLEGMKDIIEEVNRQFKDPVRFLPWNCRSFFLKKQITWTFGIFLGVDNGEICCEIAYPNPVGPQLWNSGSNDPPLYSVPIYIPGYISVLGLNSWCAPQSVFTIGWKLVEQNCHSYKEIFLMCSRLSQNSFDTLPFLFPEKDWHLNMFSNFMIFMLPFCLYRNWHDFLWTPPEKYFWYFMYV